jgi:outer membrane protein TolC
MMKKLCIAFIAIVSVGNLSAQDLVNNELKNLLTQSLSYFPKVKEVEQTVQIAKDKLKLTELNKYPELDINASYAYIQPKIALQFGGNNFQFAPEHAIGASFDATYTLLDFGRLESNIKKSKAELISTEHVAEQLKHSLFYQVSQLYYQIVFAIKGIEIQNDVLKLLNDNKKIIDVQLKNGNAIQLDVLNIQSKIDAEQNKKLELEAGFSKLINLLQYSTGTNVVKNVNFEFAIPSYTYEDALQHAVAGNPSLALAKDKVSIAKSELEVSKLNDRPILGMKASMGSKNGYVPYVTDPKFNYNAGVGLNIPLFKGGKIKQAVKLNEKNVVLQELAANSAIHDIEKDIKAAMIDIETNQSRIKNCNSQIEQAKLAQQLTQSKLLNGTATAIDITSSYTDYQRALFNKLQFEYQLNNARLELARLMGLELFH